MMSNPGKYFFVALSILIVLHFKQYFGLFGLFRWIIEPVKKITPNDKINIIEIFVLELNSTKITMNEIMKTKLIFCRDCTNFDFSGNLNLVF